jgi:hypothetical protein
VAKTYCKVFYTMIFVHLIYIFESSVRDMGRLQVI